jgi:predicted acyl esterase
MPRRAVATESLGHFGGRAFGWEFYMKQILPVLLGLVVSTAAVLTFLIMSVQSPGQELTPSGTRRDTAFYVTMRDGVQIAADLWLPPGYTSSQHVPVLMRTTRYWRQPRFGWAFRMTVASRRADIATPWPTFPLTDYLNRHGYALMFVDARGTGASGGDRVLKHSPEEVADRG